MRLQVRESEHALRKAVIWLLALTVLFIVYASLYPFDFDPARLARAGEGGWRSSFTWRRPPRTDLIANLLFYLPFGVLMTYLTHRRWGALRRVACVLLCGALLSLLVECAQLATRNRDPSITDVLINALSAGIGALLALSAHGLGLRPALPELRAQRPDGIAMLLVACWFAIHAAPFMPTQRFVRAFQNPEVVFSAPWSTAAFAGFFAGYVLLGAMLRNLLRPGSFWPVLGVLVFASLIARILFRGQHLQVSELAAALCALPVIWQMSLDNERRAYWRALLWAGPAYAFFALAPFDFGAAAPAFDWLSLPDLVHRNRGGEPGLLELLFLYVGAAWLLAEARIPPLRAGIWLVAAALLVEVAQAWQPLKSAQLVGPAAALLGVLLVRLRRAVPA